MKRVVLESPFAGERTLNIAYAFDCMLDCHKRGETPLASHLLYPQYLNDDLPEQRKLGIDAGLAWLPVCDLQAFYTDRGWSLGMIDALRRGRLIGKPFAIRSLVGKPLRPPVELEEVSVTQLFSAAMEDAQD